MAARPMCAARDDVPDGRRSSGLSVSTRWQNPVVLLALGGRSELPGSLVGILPDRVPRPSRGSYHWAFTSEPPSLHEYLKDRVAKGPLGLTFSRRASSPARPSSARGGRRGSRLERIAEGGQAHETDRAPQRSPSRRASGNGDLADKGPGPGPIAPAGSPRGWTSPGRFAPANSGVAWRTIVSQHELPPPRTPKALGQAAVPVHPGMGKEPPDNCAGDFFLLFSAFQGSEP